MNGANVDGTAENPIGQGTEASLWSVFAPLAARGIRGGIETAGVPSVTDVLGLALEHAIKHFTAATATLRGQEEHKTSVLMGFVGAYLGMYNLVSALSRGPQASLQWNAQTKKDEARTGGDFGVAVPMPGERYRLAFFQAKELKEVVRTIQDGARKVEVTKLVIDIDQPSGAYAKSHPVEEADKQQAARRQADRDLLAWCESVLEPSASSESEDRQENIDVDTGADSVHPHAHQLTRLACLHERLGAKHWIHYVCWGTTARREPVAISLQSLHDFLMGRLKEHRKQYRESERWKDKSAGQLFGKSGMTQSMAYVPVYSSADDAVCDHDSLFNVLRSLVAGSDSSDWLVLGAKEAARLVGKFIDLGAEWFIADDESEGGLANEVKENYKSARGENSDLVLTQVSLSVPASGLTQDIIHKLTIDTEAFESAMPAPSAGSKLKR